MTSSQRLRVTSVRSRGIRGMGGCIFAGSPIDTGGNVLDAGAYYVVRAPGSLLASHNRVEVGQWWRVAGVCRQRKGEVNGYQLTELQIEASELELLLPSGEHVVTLMAESDEFRGIGYGKARRLWETFGRRLYDLLDHGDTTTLATVLTEESAQAAVAAWAQFGDSRTLQWLQSKGFDVSVGRKLLRFYGSEVRVNLEDDPYRLISFCGTWKATDALARSVFNLSIDDHRRLRGAVEEALYRIFNAGHTCATRQMLDA